MKKILYILGIVFLLVGCSITNMDNTPTKRVEEYLKSYQMLDKDRISDIEEIVNNEEGLNNEQKEQYKELLKKHYQDLSYIVKEETVNGDRATVEVEIEVNDYTKVLKEVEKAKEEKREDILDDSGNIAQDLFNDFKLKLLSKTEDRVKYTIYFSLNKKDDKWVVDDIKNEDKEKILGVYEY